MSHQTGIVANEELKEFFALEELKEGAIRAFKVQIEGEDLVKKGHEYVSGNWEDDFNGITQRMAEDKTPSYIFYRLDTKNNLGYEWLFIGYCPDDSLVKLKMLHAGTRATVRRAFGDGLIKEELSATSPAEVTLAAYKHHLDSQDAPPPLTLAEQELVDLKKEEDKTEIHINTRTTHMTGIAFPLTQDAFEKVEAFQRKEITYLQLAIDVDKEIIEAVEACNPEIPEIAGFIPDDHARYHLILFKHTHEGDYQEAVVLVYSNPMYNCPVKERMLYSSAIAPLIDQLKELEIEVTKRVEITEASEVTEKFIYEEVHPLKTIVKPKFAKPKPPAGRRLNKK